ncbi:hypothetical protein POX_c03522 [Penicillium oxalicum]|uniref:hypothetical protein n=1 Tax=Penicillium oxalicum TaxID=69781 RepID=UPI0020B69E34|nr:hypothetical protein POX_c03522 [Penicillium oxalicum]KAI2790676.1 hypothetical protein POX_c03522 [Penicillium oxalicum]
MSTPAGNVRVVESGRRKKHPRLAAGGITLACPVHFTPTFRPKMATVAVDLLFRQLNLSRRCGEFSNVPVVLWRTRTADGFWLCVEATCINGRFLHPAKLGTVNCISRIKVCLRWKSLADQTKIPKPTKSTGFCSPRLTEDWEAAAIQAKVQPDTIAEHSECLFLQGSRLQRDQPLEATCFWVFIRLCSVRRGFGCSPSATADTGQRSDYVPKEVRKSLSIRDRHDATISGKLLELVRVSNLRRTGLADEIPDTIGMTISVRGFIAFTRGLPS